MSGAAKNRAYWNAASVVYQAAHGAGLREEPLSWGVWRIPESEVDVLGNLAGLDVLELGCGAAQWSHALAGIGARVVGIDLSEQQLAHARSTDSERPVAPLVQGNAERLPFRDACFDVILSDHGATSFARPERIVAEASRVLKSRGRFVFCMSTPIRDLCCPPDSDRVSTELSRDYFDLSKIEDADTVEYQLPYGAWIRLFGRHSFAIEDLVELRPPVNANTTYQDFVPAAWARRWPAEHIWRLRKAGA